MKFEYTFANEDSYTEQRLLNLESNHVLAIAGSGARVIPLFFKMPKKLTCIDSSAQQLYLTELRIAALKELTYAQFCKLLGYHDAPPDERKRLFEKLTLNTLTEKNMKAFFEKTGWQSLLFSGMWEAKLANSARLFCLCYPKLREKLNTCGSLEEQKMIYLPLRRKIKVMAFFLTLSVSMTVLIKKLLFRRTHLTFFTPLHFYGFFTRSIKNAFENFLIRNSFYYSALLIGSYNSAKAPTAEIDEKNFYQCKQAAKRCEVKYVNQDIVQHCAEVDNEYDFVSLSNVPDYLKKSETLVFMTELAKAFKDNAILVYRRSITSQIENKTNHFIAVSDKYKAILQHDSTPLYDTYIYRKTSQNPSR